MKITNLIKKRLINTTNRIYIQDTELSKTIFRPGKKYDYELSNNHKTLRIFISDSGKHIVSKRIKSTYINPVIDIRSKDIINKIQCKSNKLSIEIYQDEILVKVLNNDDSCTGRSNKLNSKVINLKPKQEIKISKKYINDLYMKKAVNDNYEQLSFNSLFSENITEVHISNRCEADNDIEYNKNIHTALRFVSLFSGAGILDKAFIDQGFKPQLAVELEKDMVETYKSNLGNHVIQADLSTYNLDNIPNAEILVGGSPCQDFSNANRKTGKILDTPKNLLIRKYIQVAKKMKSLKVFILENVPQLLTKGRKFIQEIKEELSDFEITINKVNSADFGSAQRRERAIIIGSKIGRIELKKPIVCAYKTVREAFAGLTDKTPNQMDYSKARKDTLKKMSYVKRGGNFKDIPIELRGKSCHSNIFRRLEWDKQSITIANPRKANILHPEENRILSVRECARLFDLPDNFIFRGKLASKQQMIANAVPLSLGRAIAKRIKESFFRC